MERLILFMCLLGASALSYAKEPTLPTKCLINGLFALTFDDGVTSNYPEILTILKREKVKATFFVMGETLVNPYHLAYLKQAADEGHQIANHTWSHPPNISKMPIAKLLLEIKETQNGIDLVAPFSRLMFRPPSGAINQVTYDLLTSLGYTSVLWNLDTHDWRKHRSKAQIWQSFDRVLTKANPNTMSIISLQHSRRKESVELLPQIIERGKKAGFKFVTLDGCI